MGFSAGQIPKVPLNLALLKNCDIRGVHKGEWARRNPRTARTHLEKIVMWAKDGKLRVPIDRVLPLKDTVEALKAMERRETMGKMIVRVRGSI